MTVQVAPVQKKPDSFAQYGSLLGMGVGAYFGGPAGAATGGNVGGAVGGAMSQNNKVAAAPIQTPSESSPASRRMESLEADPAAQMRQGKIALASMDDQTRKAFEPVMDEGLRRAAEERKKQYGYGYTGQTTT